MLEWISESEQLPLVGETILLATPRQFDVFWDIRTAWLSVRHEDVLPVPVKPGGRWPVDYSWRLGNSRDAGIVIVSGNSWWSRLDQISLPPGANHRIVNGYHCIEQLGSVFIPKGANSG